MQKKHQISRRVELVIDSLILFMKLSWFYLTAINIT